MLNALIDPSRVGSGILASFDAGMQRGKEVATKNALAAYAAKPSVETVNALLPLNPELALKLQEHERQVRFGEAASRFMGGGRGALGGVGQVPGQTPGIGDGIPGNRRMDGSTVPTNDAMLDPVLSPGGGIGGNREPQQNPDFRVLGAPTSDADAAFLEMLKQDPKAAFAIDSSMRDRAADRLKLQRDAYGLAVSRLASAKDQASYDAVLAEVQSQIEPLGISVTDHLPQQFPGVDGLRDLRLKALDAKDQLSFFLQESNIEADNKRQDRNTESLITDRTERRADQRRYNEGRLGIARDRANIYRENSNRPAGGGGRGRAASAPAAPVKVSTPAEAMKLPKGTRYTTPDGKVMVR